MDKELQSLIKIIYGDKQIDDRFLSKIIASWNSNFNGYRDVMRKHAADKEKAVNESNRSNKPNSPAFQSHTTLQVQPVSAIQQIPTIPTTVTTTPSNDFSNIANFNDAFKQARKAGLKTFIWKKTKGNPSGLFSTELASKQSEKKTETKGLGINTETLQKLKEKTDKLMPEAIPADELVRKWIDKGYLPNIRSEEDALEAQIEELEAPSRKQERDAAWNFAKVHGNLPGTFIDGVYRPDDSDNYFNFPAYKYNYRGNDYLINEYSKLYGTQLHPDDIEYFIEQDLDKERVRFEERVRKNQEKVQSKKQGGTMNKIKYFAPGGTVSNGQSNGQADAFMQAVLQGNSEAIGQLIEAAKQGDKNADKLIQTILQEDKKGNQQVTKAASVIKQLLNQTVSAKWGSKLDYVKSLKYGKGGKHSCPACEQKVEMKKCGGKKAKKHFFGGDFDVNEKNPMRMSNGKNVVGIINRERFKNSSNRGLSQTIYDSTGRPVVQKDKTSDGGEREIYYNVPKPIKRKGLFGPRHEMVNDTVYISGTPEMFENAPNMSTIEKRHQAYNFAQGVE